MKSLLALIPMAGLAAAQVYTPPAGNTQNQQGNNNTGGDTTIVRKPQDKPAASPLGQEIPMLDPSAETITVGGVAIPLGDNRVLKARFEKYLNQPPESTEAAEEYRKTIRIILDTISPFHPGGPKIYEAFKHLPSAASYPGDANICGSLPEAIYVAMLAKQDVNGLKQLNDSIEQEKKSIIRQGDWDARHETDKTLGDAQPQGGKKGQDAHNKPAQNPGAGVVSLRYVDTLRRITEIEALKKANIARTEVQTIQTKAQYQVNMVQWFAERRYEHVLMAARFYNQIWRDGDTTLRINKDSDVSKLFSQSMGINPTVASLDAFSNEAIREVDKYIEAFDLLLSRNELHSASQRLMEAYALGEYLGPVATLPLEKKLRIVAYTRDLNELYGTLQAHDYTKAKEITERLKSTAKDFPSSKVDSAISAYTLSSDLAIEEAKAHLIAKDNEKHAEKIRAATEIWPTNPKLAEFRNLIGSASTVMQARNDFDRLLSEGNYRQIFKEQYRIAPAIQGDTQREDAFKQIITNLTSIEGAIGKANEFSKMGQDYAAWEQLAELREKFKDDPKLGRELELLAPKVADFTKALDRASQFEKRTPKQTGSALAWYLKAKSIFPLSTFAEAGIHRLLDDVIPESKPSTAQDVKPATAESN